MINVDTRADRATVYFDYERNDPAFDSEWQYVVTIIEDQTIVINGSKYYIEDILEHVTPIS